MDNDGYISNGELFQVLAMKSTKDTHKNFPLQQALSLSWPGVEDDGGKQLERHPAAAGDQFTISLVHADFLYEKWKKRQQQQKMKALLCLSAI